MSSRADDATIVASRGDALLVEVDAYVRALQGDYARASRAERARFGALTLERLLQRVWQHFYADSSRRGVARVLPDTLPFALAAVPALADVAALQARVTARVVAAVATRPLVTLHELEQELCVSEGVTCYDDLGLGPRLSCLPVVQQFFQVRGDTPVARVTSAQVLAFALATRACDDDDNDDKDDHSTCHGDSRRHDDVAFVHGSGDARDLVNAFARHYEATQQRRRQQQDDDENVSAHGAQTRRGHRRAARLTSNRQLGIHIQSFARFTNLLQQESGQARLTLRNAIATAQARLTQNAPLYRATIAALDAALRDVLVHNNDNNNAAAQTSLSFAVPMSEAAARRTTVPLTCWTASSNASRSAAAAVHAARGGLCLPICIGHATTTTTRAPPPPAAAAATPTPPTSTTTPVAPAVPQRHPLRGCTIRDTAACIVAATDCVAATMPVAAVAASAAAPSAQTTTTTTTQAAVAADGVATTTANAPRASTHAALEQWLVTAMTCDNSDDNNDDNSDDTNTSDGAAVARVEQAIDVLSSVVVGSRLRVALVRRVFAQLAAMATARRAVTSLLRACAATPLLPLPHPHYTRVYNNDNDNDNKKSSSNDDDDEYWEVVYVASAEEVCWLPLAQHDDDDDDDDDDGVSSQRAVIFCTALAPLYGDALRAFFCDVCGVAVHAHLACWWACAAIARRRYSSDLLRTSLSSSSSFVQRYMNTFARCVLSDYRARVAALLLQQQTTTHNNDNDNDNDNDSDDEDGRVARLAAAGKRALQQLCASVPAGVASEVHWLPCDRAGWCRAVDGVLYCTPQHYSVSGCRLVATRSHHEDDDAADDDTCSAATSEQQPPPLLLLPLAAEPHMAVAAVLQRCGVRALSACVRTTVCYSSLTHDRDVAADVAMLHRCVAALLPYVLALLARDDAVVYALTRCHGNDDDTAATTMTSGGGGGLTRRLAQLRVLYGDGVTRTEQLCSSSSGSSNAVCYTSRQTVRLCYVAAHHTLYSAAESCTPRVLAHALLPLFLPYAPTRAVQTRLLALLSDTAAVVLGTANNNSNNISSATTTAPDVRGHAFTSASCDVSPSLVRALDAVAQRQHGVVVSRALRRAAHAMGVAAPPSTRPQSRFPPGCDGFANPPLQHHSNNSSRRSSSHGGYTSSHAGAAAATLSAAVVLCGRGRPGVDAWCVRSLPQWTDDDGGCGASVHAELQALLSQPLSSSSSQAQQQPPPPSHACTRPRRTHARIDLCGGDDNDVVAALSADDDDEDDGIVRFASSSSLSPRKRARDVATDYGNDDGGTTTPYTTLPAFVASDLGGGSSNGGGGDGGARASAVAAERFVYEQLCREYADDAEVRVMWLNEASESGTPYDIVVARYTATTAATTSHAQRPPQTPQVLQLVEVKSTTSRQRRDFELSPRELVTAARYGAAYAIYRVFAASAHSPQHMRVRVYRDVLQQWYTGRLSISGELRVLPTS